MKLVNFETFVNLARYRSLTRVSEVMDASTSTILRRIRSVEDEYGVALVERFPKGIKLTKEGMLFCDYSLSVLKRDAELRAAVSRSSGEVKRVTVRVGMNPSMGTIFTEKILKAVNEKVNNLSVSVNFVVPDSQNPLGELDIYILPIDCSHTSFNKTLLTRSKFLFCASRKYLSQYGCVSSINDLHRHKIIYTKMAHEPEEWAWKSSDGSEGVIHLKPDFCSTTFQMSASLVKQDLGVSLLPPETAVNLLKEDVRILFDGFTFSEKDLYMYVNGNTAHQPEIEVFISTIKTFFEGR